MSFRNCLMFSSRSCISLILSKQTFWSCWGIFIWLYTYALAMCFMELLMIFVLSIFNARSSICHAWNSSYWHSMWIIRHLTPIFAESGAFSFHLYYTPMQCLVITFINPLHKFEYTHWINCTINNLFGM